MRAPESCGGVVEGQGGGEGCWRLGVAEEGRGGEGEEGVRKVLEREDLVLFF